MVGLLVGVALAVVPQGFVERPALESRIAFVSGAPTVVLCAQTIEDWQAELQARNDRGDALGFAIPGQAEVHLSPTICAPLLAKINGHKVDLLTFGASAELLAHEGEHVAGNIDEGVTECAALAALPRLLRTQFGIKKPVTMYQVMRGAKLRHAAAISFSPLYSGPCDA